MTVNISKPPPSEKKYKTILADPPWPEYGCGKIKRGADRHYPLMSIKEIAALGKFVQSIAADDAHLYLWVTNNYLEAAFKVVAAWGFTYVTKIDWVKQLRPCRTRRRMVRVSKNDWRGRSSATLQKTPQDPRVGREGELRPVP